MPGKYLEKNYCHCSACSQPNVITWHGNPNIDLAPFLERNFEPGLSYSMKKRKGWLLAGEVCNHLMNRPRNSNELIVLCKWNRYFEDKSNMCLHNTFDETGDKITVLGARTNLNSYIHQLLYPQQNGKTSRQANTFRKPQRQHRNHHKPIKTTDDNKDVKIRPKPEKSLASVEIGGSFTYLKSWAFRNPWLDINDHKKHEILRDIKDAYKEWMSQNDTRFSSDIEDNVREFDAPNKENNCDKQLYFLQKDLPSSMNYTNDDAVVEFTFPSAFSENILNEQKQTAWYIITMPELILIDVKQAVEKFGLVAEQSVFCLSYFTPLCFVIDLSTLFSNLVHQTCTNLKELKVFLLVEQQQIENIADEMKHISYCSDLLTPYLVQLQIKNCSSSCVDESWKINKVKQFKNVNSPRNLKPLYCDGIINLIASVIKTITNMPEYSLKSMEDIPSTEDPLLHEFEIISSREKKSCICSTESNDSYEIIEIEDASHSNSKETEVKTCILCSIYVSEKKSISEADQHKLRDASNILTLCKSKHLACIECVQVYVKHLVESSQISYSTNGVPQINCPISNCQHLLNPSAQLHAIPACQLVELWKSDPTTNR